MPDRPTPPGGATVAAALVGAAALVVLGGLLVWVGDAVRSAAPAARSPTAPSPGSAATASASPARAADGYRFWATEAGRPVRWDPCRPIRWVLNRSGMPAGARADLERAMDRITRITGIAFERVGTTAEPPSGDRPVYQPDRYGQRWAPVLVAWAPAHHGGLPLADTDRAVAIPVAVSAEGPDVFVSGQVVLNGDRRLAPGFGDRADARGAVMLHELAHLVGLDHVDDPSQLMHRFPGSGPVRFGAGDRAGLRALGRAAGCRPPPAPGPRDITYAEATAVPARGHADTGPVVSRSSPRPRRR